MESIITAAREAINDSAMTMNETNGINDDTVSLSRFDAEHQYSFGSIWIASAGMDRPGMRERVQKTLTQKLNLDKSVNMRITNDIDLLAAAMTRHPETSSSLVIVAGTGSIAIRYNLGGNENMPRRVARAGGWGHLLGDEGAGYAIGRQAIRKTLSSLENLTLSHRKSSLSPLETKILNFFSSSSFNTESDIEKVDLLSNVLMGSDDRTVKSRIASVAQMILNSGGRGDAEAVDIIARQVSDFIDNTLSRLLDPKSHGYVDPSKCGLILSGGVMLHSVYQTIFQLALAKHGIRFCYTEAVSNAAQVGAEFLNQSDARSKIFNGPSS